jgi:predicted DNA-binding ribbon-helix-helix protein
MGQQQHRAAEAMRHSDPELRLQTVLRAVYVGARRTTMRLEPVMWEALAEIADERCLSVPDLLSEIEQAQGGSNLSAAVRVYIVEYYRDKLRGRDG